MLKIKIIFINENNGKNILQTEELLLSLYRKTKTNSSMVYIKDIIDWVYPMFGNIHIMPYGKLLVSDGVDDKVCPTKGDKETDTDGYQYITFKRKRYKLITYYKNNMRCLKLEEVKK